MIYKVEQYVLELINGTGTLYDQNKLLLRGDGYLCIKHLLHLTNNNQKVRDKFKAQLEMREACKWKKEDQKLADQKRIEEQTYTTDSQYKKIKSRKK